MHTFVVANQKGGVGKTTTALALASLLQQDGRVLLIDADPQANASDTYGAKIEGAATLYDVVVDEEKTPALEAIQFLELGDIIASDPLLRKADNAMSDTIDGMYRMSDALSGLEECYDYIVIDTGPALNMLLYNCLVAADSVIIPVSAGRYSLVGLSQLNDTIAAIKKRQNPKLVIDGLLLVQYDGRTNLAKGALETLKKDAEILHTTLFEHPIRECVKCGEAQAKKESLFTYAPDCTTALDYIELYSELMKRYK